MIFFRFSRFSPFAEEGFTCLDHSAMSKKKRSIFRRTNSAIFSILQFRRKNFFPACATGESQSPMYTQKKRNSTRATSSTKARRSTQVRLCHTVKCLKHLNTVKCVYMRDIRKKSKQLSLKRVQSHNFFSW